MEKTQGNPYSSPRKHQHPYIGLKYARYYAWEEGYHSRDALVVDLREALEGLLRDYIHCAAGAEGILMPWRDRMVKRVRAAIARAEGVQE